MGESKLINAIHHIIELKFHDKSIKQVISNMSQLLFLKIYLKYI